MGLFDSELTLPGVATDILPATNNSNVEYGTTESVTVIGTAFNGPVGEPQKIGSPEMAKYIFGESFDPVTKREATLVAEIKDTYDRGCRNIYAVRVSGKEMYKDYELAIETNLKLRVSGYFPHNGNKECFMTYEMTQGSEKAFGLNEGVIRIYKPADRTVISEKMAGVVDDVNSTLVTEIILDSEGYSKDSRLCDVLDVINKKGTNNVLKFSLVDENGVQKTNASKEVQEIPVGALFPGIYTLCRDKASKQVQLLTDIEVIRADLETGVGKLYPASHEVVWKRLKANTDPSKPYPIFAESVSKFQTLLSLGYNINNHFDFLKTHKEIDKVALVNSIDYEEAEIDGLELYKKLGSGYLRTACLKELSTGKYKVIPATDDDNKKVLAIEDGIYSKLQMHETDYIVLAAATAETDITGKLPKKSEFRVAKTLGYDLKIDSQKYMSVISKVNSKDIESQQVKYDISVQYANKEDFPTTKTVLTDMSDKKVIRIPSISKAPTERAKGVQEGQLVFCIADSKLYKLKDKMFVEVPNTLLEDGTLILTQKTETVESASVEKLVLFKKQVDSYVAAAAADLGASKKYFVAMSGARANVYEIGTEDKITPFISLKDLANGLLDEEDFVTSFVEEDMPILNTVTGENLTHVKIYATCMEYSLVAELVEELNACEGLKNKFLFEANWDGEIANEDCPINKPIVGASYNKEDEIAYDTTLHIPYTTTDNFARHLAQHCLYTSLRSYPCHGVIGCDKLNGISLSTIADRVNTICELNLDMYAKKSNGNNLLDTDNNPWPIGRCISVVFAQYPVSTGSGYDYVSSGASGYAGMVSTLDADRSSTNQEINIPTNNMMMSLSNYQLTKLNSAGIVCIKQVGNKVVVVDGITQAPADSPYRRLSTTKTINAVAKLLKTAIQPFIGKQQTPANMNSLETAIKSVLNSVKGVLINDYDYTVETDAQSNLLGIVKINYVIVPAAEIKQVRNTITVQ